MEISETGLNLIKKSEGLRLTAYQDQGGVWTIGYGHTGHDVHEGATITEAQAEDLLYRDVQSAQLWVNHLVKVPLTQVQFDALVDFAFNLGLEALKHSTLLRVLNKGNYQAAKAEFLKWDHIAGAVSEGLLKRREAEAQLWG